MGTLYDTDFVAWAYEQAELLRAGDLPAIDAFNIAERQMERAWRTAVASASRETGLVFPETSIWPIDQVLDPDFFPD